MKVYKKKRLCDCPLKRENNLSLYFTAIYKIKIVINVKPEFDIKIVSFCWK